MIKKKILSVVISGALILQLTGCGNESVEKVVLQKDVLTASQTEKNGERQEQVKKKLPVILGVESIDLELIDREVFRTGFYLNGEVYGFISNGYGMMKSSNIPKEGYLKDGCTRDKLYKLDKDNNLVETSKQMLQRGFLIEKMMEYDGEKYFEIDYTKEDIPRVREDLSKELQKRKIGDKDYLHKTFINDREYLNFSTSNDKRYLYDDKENKFYEIKDKDKFWDVLYVAGIKSNVHVDKDFKCYKMGFHENYIDFEEYIDLKEYMNFKENDDLKEVSIQRLNDNEILILEMGFLREDGYFSYHPLIETLSISKFNFITNQFTELLKVGEDKHISWLSWAGDILVFDEFEEKDGYILPKTRYFKIIEGDELKTIYKESIEDEGKTLSPYNRVIMNEDKKELFLSKDVTDMKDGVETTKDVIYKRYTFE